MSSDAIVLTSHQPGHPERSARSSAPQPAASARSHRDAPAETLVPAGFRFEGVVAFDGAARIEGELSGRVEGRGRLEIGVGGRVEGGVQADEVISSGVVEGDVEAAVRAELREGACLNGAIRTPALVMHEGAVLNGPCRIEPAAESADSPAATNRCAG